VNHALLVFLLQIVLWWSTWLCILCLLLFILDVVLSAWQRRRTARRSLHAALAAISAERDASVSRLTTAYAIAQQQIRIVSVEGTGHR
jgi:biopolymer transport protein ExbB/TolQ